MLSYCETINVCCLLVLRNRVSGVQIEYALARASHGYILGDHVNKHILFNGIMNRDALLESEAQQFLIT